MSLIVRSGTCSFRYSGVFSLVFFYGACVIYFYFLPHIQKDSFYLGVNMNAFFGKGKTMIRHILTIFAYANSGKLKSPSELSSAGIFIITASHCFWCISNQSTGSPLTCWEMSSGTVKLDPLQAQSKSLQILYCLEFFLFFLFLKLHLPSQLISQWQANEKILCTASSRWQLDVTSDQGQVLRWVLCEINRLFNCWSHSLNNKLRFFFFDGLRQGEAEEG